MGKSTFYTLFPLATNTHLIKDVGMIPLYMRKKYGYDSVLVCYKCSKETYIKRSLKDQVNIIDESYSYIENEASGLRIHFLKEKGRIKGIELAFLKYIISTATKIDILNLYHITFQTMIYGLVYKLLHRHGILYVKADTNYSFLKKYGVYPIGNSVLKRAVLRTAWKLFIRAIDIISAETHDAVDELRKVLNIYRDKIIYVPNGFNEDGILKSGLKIKQFHEKENIILYVGRVGSYPKNTEMLLRAIEKIDLNQWQVLIVGPVAKSFEPYIANYYVKNPHLMEKVIFVGYVKKPALYEYYNRAKIFCLTSTSEGFPLVFPEAIYFGNFIISSEVSSALDITDNQRIGVIVKNEDSDALAEALKIMINNKDDLRWYYPRIRQFAEKHFKWSEIVTRLQKKIEGC